MRRVFLAAVYASALIGALELLERATAQGKPNILLITLDTTRADRMGFLGSTRGLTPSMDALARTATVFERAFAQAPITTVSHATILSGTYPPLHRVDDFGAPLPATVAYLPDILKTNGYRTAAFIGSLILDPLNGTAPGFDRGFDVYDAGFRLRRPGEDRYTTVERRGDEVVRRATAWLSARDTKQAGAPFFLWVHLFDPHDPYEPPSDLRARFAKEPYDGEIAFTDRQVGRLVAAAGAGAGATIVIAGDHGESLGDHGETTHGLFLYDATLRVPLIVRTAGRGAGVRVPTRVRLADIAPTILESAGLAIPSAVQGQSLLALMRDGAKAEDRPVYSESSYPRRAFGWSPLLAWRADRFLYVRAPKRELYDVISDPEATRNLALSRGRLADGLDGELAQFLGRSGTAASAKARVDPAVAERLAALGYVGGSSATPKASGVDPKDRIAIANTLHEAIVAVEDAAFTRAIPLLEKVVAGEPDIPIAQLNLGVARARQRQYARAIPPLRRAATLQPDNMRGHYELGLALYETGDLKGAAGELAVVATALPKWADARYSLGSVYARIDRVGDAVGELRAALALEPRHFRANLLLGRLLTLTGKAAEAVPFLQTAVDVDPKSTEARQFLADALAKK